MKLIFDSGKIWDSKFFKIENLKKGGAKGGHPPRYWLLQWLCKKSDFSFKKSLSEVRMMICMVGTNVLEWCPPLFCPPFSCPPFCTPFHLHIPSMKNMKFSRFLSISSWFGGTHRPLPPFYLPFLYLKSSNDLLQILYVWFLPKMLCFLCTDPFPKNESDPWLCKKCCLNVDPMLILNF